MIARSRETIPGFEVPLHRALTEPVLLGGAPRGMAIFIGTVAAAIGLGLQLWLAGILIWVVGHAAAVRAARFDPQFPGVLARHLRHRVWLEA